MRQNEGRSPLRGWHSRPRGVPAYSKSSASLLIEKPMCVGCVATPSWASSRLKFG